jgi:hypothetical protein
MFDFAYGINILVAWQCNTSLSHVIRLRARSFETLCYSNDLKTILQHLGPQMKQLVTPQLPPIGSSVYDNLLTCY